MGGRLTQTARDDGLEVDDGGGEAGAVEGLAGDIERGEEEGRHGPRATRSMCLRVCVRMPQSASASRAR